MNDVLLKRKVILKKKSETVLFSFSGLLKVRLLWNSSTDLDLCVFYKRKDDTVGGVFSNYFRQRRSDLGSLSEFPYMLHLGDAPEPSLGGESVEQINIVNLDEIAEAYICVLNYTKVIEGEESNFAKDSGRVEILSDSGDYYELKIDSAEEGHLYCVCSIKNNNGVNTVVYQNIVMGLGTAYDVIPGMSLICE